MTGDTVVVPRIDRLARNLTEGLKTIEELHDKGINIRSLAERLDTGDDSPTSRLMLHMLLSLAEWERGTIRDRIKAGVDRAAAEGRTGGRPPALDSEKLHAVRDFLANNNGNISAAHCTFKVSRATIKGRQGRDLCGPKRHALIPRGEPKLRPRWDVHSRGDEDWLGCASEALLSVLGE